MGDENTDIAEADVGVDEEADGQAGEAWGA